MNAENGFLLLIERQPQSGARNMAIDEALLEAARREQFTALRFYRWSEPTLSLGYFQKTLPENLPAELKELAQVRRLSGGGAILHHHEWTYSCVLPPFHPIAADPLTLYEIVHRKIVMLLNEQHIAVKLRGASTSESFDEPFLCFGRHDPRDIVLGKHKIVGSAQRRRRGAVLQHGSLLLHRSPFAPEYSGLFDLVEEPPLVDEWIPALASRLTPLLNVFTSQRFSDLPEHIAEEAERLEREKYDRLTWR